jgi:hypothetical protein
MTTEQYLNLITSAWRQKPNFQKVVSTGVSVSVRVQELLAQMIPLFDVDLAVGEQLDFIGLWVGASRNVAIPISGVYFSWNSSDSAEGWNVGSWAPADQPTSITVLPDPQYRTLIKAKIAANKWNGSIENAYVVWDEIFKDIKILIQDNQDMTYNLGFYGGTIDSLTLALITQGYIPLKPEGVRLAAVFTPADTGTIFSWNSDSDYLAGWNESSWANFYAIT